jgi:predicted restriction endonuclease
MIDRSKEIWLVAFFLSKYDDKVNHKTTPPNELGVVQWNEAYNLFYESLNDGRTIGEFEHSLKNARDAFDSHIKNSQRVGWRDKSGLPNALNKIPKAILEKYDQLSRSEVWEEVKFFSGRKISKKVFVDLEAIQDSESDKDKVSQTEGGRKVVISFRYERKPSLRDEAFKAHGYDCAVCTFNFEKVYGEWGKQFIEVHHLEPLASNGGRSKIVNAETDLIVLCSNCHSMVHRQKGITLTVDELRAKMKVILSYKPAEL